MLNGDRLVLVSRKDCDTIAGKGEYPATSKEAVLCRLTRGGSAQRGGSWWGVPGPRNMKGRNVTGNTKFFLHVDAVVLQ
jgi:hypothetical protein